MNRPAGNSSRSRITVCEKNTNSTQATTVFVLPARLQTYSLTADLIKNLGRTVIGSKPTAYLPRQRDGDLRGPSGKRGKIE